MTLHFICTGNIYRSRLAEAYSASKGVPELRVLSSGIGTTLNGDLSIAPYAARILRAYGLERFAAPAWQQTTPALVRASDILVFMEREHHGYCQNWLDTSRQKYNIWHIPDIGSRVGSEITTEVERSFAAIRRQTDLLLTDLGFS